MVDPDAEARAAKLAEGLPAGPGGASGKVVFTADRAEELAKQGEKIILVRNETSPEDVHGMHAAQGILTARGGMTSHAALVARGWGKCCIVGCSDLKINAAKKTLAVAGKTYTEGDPLTLNGTLGNVYEGVMPLLPADPDRNKWYKKLMTWADKTRKLGVRTNADTPEDAARAIAFGAEGIGLCRTEHMFFEPERIKFVRQMILAQDADDRRAAVMKLLPFQRDDFYGILKAMQGKPVTIRTLDPPLHEFIGGLDDAQVGSLAKNLGVSADVIKGRIEELHEFNPMLGHRGCRLGIVYPEITEMQARAIFEAAAQLTKEKVKVFPEVMIPLVGTVTELRDQADIVRRVADEVMDAQKTKFKYLVGTMIELPRGCLTADDIAEVAEFFSFGTNDLTQTTYGVSRDDIGGFLPDYLERGIWADDPFQTIDQPGVGRLVEIGVTKGRKTSKQLKVGICGEHGGDPRSVAFCHRTGLTYVSCSPYRVPVARLAAAQAVIGKLPEEK
jgi:pyruvate,orthophosphate dikinase